MRRFTDWIFIIAFAAVGIVARVSGATPTVDFAGIKYHLASVTAAADGTLNEYVPGGESVYSWTTYLAVRGYKAGGDLPSQVRAWVRHVHPLLIKTIQFYGHGDPKKDVVVEAWLSSPDHTYIEIDLYRFVVEAKSQKLKSYQFAQKIMVPKKTVLFGKTTMQFDPTAFTKNRDALFRAIVNLHLPVHEKLPPAQPASP